MDTYTQIYFRPHCVSDVLQPERADADPLADHGRGDARAGADPGGGGRAARRLLHARDALPPRPLPRRADLALRRPPRQLRRHRQVHRPLRLRPEELRHAMHRTLQVKL